MYTTDSVKVDFVKVGNRYINLGNVTSVIKDPMEPQDVTVYFNTSTTNEDIGVVALDRERFLGSEATCLLRWLDRISVDAVQAWLDEQRQ